MMHDLLARLRTLLIGRGLRRDYERNMRAADKLDAAVKEMLKQ